MAGHEQLIYVPVETGPAYFGPGDRYVFLVTGKDSGGAYFILEATVPPGGGPPPHKHHREVECFYLLEGALTVQVSDREVQASAGDFVHVPRGTTHAFQNSGDKTARMLAVFSPAGMEGYFEEATNPAPDRFATPPPPTEELIARMVAAGPKHGVEWV